MTYELTQSRLQELVSYDQKTGIFHRLLPVSNILAGPINPKPNKIGYTRMHVDGRLYYLHRLAWLYVYGVWPVEIDHIDGNKANNKLSNLRDISHAQNMQNISKKSKAVSGLKGAYYHPDCKMWQAKIRYQSKTKSLGYFKTKEEANAMYLQAKSNLHEFFTGRSN